MIHTCTSECSHKRVPDLGGFLVDCPITEDRAEREAALRRLWVDGPGLRDQTLTDRLDYLGAYGPDEDRRHTWRVGGKAWKPLPVSRDSGEGDNAKREIKCEYRREVWMGSGQPVGPVDFSRSAEAADVAYPAPELTSGMPSDLEPSDPAAGLRSLALSYGWIGTITFARGHVPHASWGTPGKVAKFSEAVRLRRGDQRAVAVRMDGSWSSLWTWSPTQFFEPYSTLGAFQEALT